MAGYATDEDREAFATAIAGDTDEGTPEASEEPDAPDAEDTPDDDAEGEGTGESTAGEDEETPDEQSEVTPDDPTFTVSVDGKDVDLPLSELTKGYLRQSDYTRKVQYIARERDRLRDAEVIQAALDNNPLETVKRIVAHYGLDAEGIYEDGEAPKGPSPEAQRLADLERWRAEQVARDREASVNAELDRLHRDYGEFDEDALFTFAVERNIMDLEVALRALTFGKVQADRRETKRKVSAVNGGAGHSSIAKPKVPPDEIVTFQDAYAAAKREVTSGT